MYIYNERKCVTIYGKLRLIIECTYFYGQTDANNSRKFHVKNTPSEGYIFVKFLEEY